MSQRFTSAHCFMNCIAPQAPLAVGQMLPGTPLCRQSLCSWGCCECCAGQTSASKRMPDVEDAADGAFAGRRVLIVGGRAHSDCHGTVSQLAMVVCVSITHACGR
jgi:hypothetical protein